MSDTIRLPDQKFSPAHGKRARDYIAARRADGWTVESHLDDSGALDVWVVSAWRKLAPASW